MIFVTVGTHEQPFDRLLTEIDRLKENGTIQEAVMIQSGFSTYEPKYCEWKKLIPYAEMIKNVKEARIVITHGGPASFMMALQEEKIPIVVPRRAEFDEHVNDHQAEFAAAVAKRYGNIIPVMDIAELETIVSDYDQIVSKMSSKVTSNNAKFNEAFEKIVEEVVK